MKGLILLWMAENFLKCPQQSKNPEEVGEQYFNDLLSRSFFQQSGKSRFIMPGLLHDLADYVSGDVCFRLEVDKKKSIPKAARHFSIVIGELEYFDGFGSTYDVAKRLRTFIPANTRDYPRWLCKISSNELFSNFKSLRVLSLFHCGALTDLSESLGKLKHLRSLDLSETGIKRLPDSTCSLYNLQILKLNSCRNLVELPSKLHQLTNLHCLEFKYSKVRRMPMHLGKLKNLRVLSYFYVGESSEFGIEQLQGLNLHESLSIQQLDNIVNPSNALAANLEKKTHLEKLELKWEISHIPDDARKEKEVLQSLQPSKHLNDLSIQNYSGTQFPSWLSNFNVVSLHLISCKYCVVLPPLGNLPFLKELLIIGFDGIVSIGAEFYGSSSPSFRSLETLFINDMKEWEEWECQAAAFPCLQFLEIMECPKLKGLSEQLLGVKTVKLHSCNRLGISRFDIETTPLERIEHSISNASLSVDGCPNMSIPVGCCYDFLVKMDIRNTDCLSTISLDSFPNLCTLGLKGCCNLQKISLEHTHNKLKDLLISYCPQFKSFPSEGLPAPSLAEFKLESLKNLKLLPKGMHILLPLLTELGIMDCPLVEMFSDGGLPSNIKRVSLSSLKLIASLKGAFAANASPQILLIDRVDVESFPDEGYLPLSLTCLQISNCPNLKTLDYEGLCQLSSLKELHIRCCPSLRSLPKKGLPNSISTLRITLSRMLQKRCEKPGGEDWIKIAHIKNPYIQKP